MTTDQLIEVAKVAIPAVFALLGWLGSRKNGRKIAANDVKTDLAIEGVNKVAHGINGRLQTLIEVVASEQKLLGLQEGILQGLSMAEERRIAGQLAHAQGLAQGKAEGPDRPHIIPIGL